MALTTLSKGDKMEKEIFDGCAVGKFCEGICRKLHKSKFNPATKTVTECPAFYKFYFEKRRIESPRSFKKSIEKWVKIEMR
jgi:hypothetical protein